MREVADRCERRPSQGVVAFRGSRPREPARSKRNELVYSPESRLGSECFYPRSLSQWCHNHSRLWVRSPSVATLRLRQQTTDNRQQTADGRPRATCNRQQAAGSGHRVPGVPCDGGQGPGRGGRSQSGHWRVRFQLMRSPFAQSPARQSLHARPSPSATATATASLPSPASPLATHRRRPQPAFLPQLVVFASLMIQSFFLCVVF